jgi:hypothetical protein
MTLTRLIFDPLAVAVVLMALGVIVDVLSLRLQPARSRDGPRGG